MRRTRRASSGTANPGRLEHGESASLAEVPLTSPPLAPEVSAELERLAAEKQALMDEQRHEDAARVAGREHRLRAAAAALVRTWQQREVSD